MNMRVMLAAASAVAIAGCNQSSESTSGKEALSATAAAAAATPKHPTYCFFKDSDTKSWSAGRGVGGNVTIKGKAHLDDTRYMGGLGQPEISGSTAKLWLTMDPNGGPYAAPENWWDVTAAVPGSSGVDAVTIMCGTKTVAQLKVAGGR